MTDSPQTASRQESNLQCHYGEAFEFLQLLDPDDRFSFQTTGEGKEGRADRKLAQTHHGAFGRFAPFLGRLNIRFKAAVYVTVNATNLKGRTAAHIVRKRAVWADLDKGLPAAWLLWPSIIVETSPGRYQAYWLLSDDMSDADHISVVLRIAHDYGGDTGVATIERVMRVPGFWHQKGAPFRVRIVEAMGKHYTAAQLMDAHPPLPAQREGPDAVPRGDAPSLDLLRDAMRFIDPDMRDKRKGNTRTVWLSVGMALHYEHGDAARELWDSWSSGDPKDGWRHQSSKYDEAQQEKDWRSFGKRKGGKLVTAGTIFDLARKNGWQRPRGSADEDFEGIMDTVSAEDFFSYLPAHAYIFAPTGGMWPAVSVNARLPEIGKLKPSVWLDQHRRVEQMTWMPGQPQLIQGRLFTDGGWNARPGCATFNLYRPPAVAHGDPRDILPWHMHLHRIYPHDAGHIERWLAHRVQRPGEKINHGLVLGGPQGIGKDSIVEPAKHAVGKWNFAEIKPAALLGRFNPFVKSVILRISEAQDLGGINRYSFYESSKNYMAAPPDVITVDEKHVREYPVLNCCGVIITTNHPTGGLYLPADDRRHYVAWSEARKEEFHERYWNDLWGWYESGGYGHVAAHLASLDLSGFNPKAAPPKTEAFWRMVDSERSEEESDLADLIESIGKPAALTLAELKAKAVSSNAALLSFLTDRSKRRVISHRLADAGYVPVRCPTSAKDGRWTMRDGSKLTIYARTDLSEGARKTAASKLASGVLRQYQGVK